MHYKKLKKVVSHGKCIEDAETKAARSKRKKRRESKLCSVSRKTTSSRRETKFTARKGSTGATREKEFGG